MSRADKYVALRATDTDEVIVHAAGTITNYATLCGASSDDDMYEAVNLPKGARINCAFCKAAFDLAREFRESDFATVLK